MYCKQPNRAVKEQTSQNSASLIGAINCVLVLVNFISVFAKVVIHLWNDWHRWNCCALNINDKLAGVRRCTPCTLVWQFSAAEPANVKAACWVNSPNCNKTTELEAFLRSQSDCPAHSHRGGVAVVVARAACARSVHDDPLRRTSRCCCWVKRATRPVGGCFTHGWFQHIRLRPPSFLLTQGDNDHRVVFCVLGATIMSITCQSNFSPPHCFPALVHQEPCRSYGGCGGQTLLEPRFNADSSMLLTLLLLPIASSCGRSVNSNQWPVSLWISGITCWKTGQGTNRMGWCVTPAKMLPVTPKNVRAADLPLSPFCFPLY